jgi:hypothetical protein
MQSRPRCLPSSTKHWTGRGNSPRPKGTTEETKVSRPRRDHGGSVTSRGGGAPYRQRAHEQSQQGTRGVGAGAAQTARHRDATRFQAKDHSMRQGLKEKPLSHLCHRTSPTHSILEGSDGHDR